MPQVPIGYVDVWMRYLQAGDPEPMYTSLGFEIEEPPFTQANALALSNFLNDCLGPVISGDVNWTGSLCKVGSDGGDLIYEVSTFDPGGVASAPLPNNCAVLVRKRTEIGGKRGRGRMFIPGVSREGVDGAGMLNTGTKNAWSAATALIFNANGTANTNVGQPVLFHQTPPYEPSVIVSLSVHPKISTQRRRMRP